MARIIARSQLPPRGWIFYDGECGFCSRWVRSWANTLRRHGFEPTALQPPWVSERLQIPLDDLLSDIRLLTSQGRLMSGADVYLYVARHIWWSWPFFALFSLPGFKQLLEIGYRRFARNRHCISHSCRFDPP